MIYTSFYSNHKEFPRGIKVLSISRYRPNYLDVATIYLLTPSRDLLMQWKLNRINEQQYTEIYLNNLLSKIKNVKEIFLELDKDYCLLLCYEPKGEFCHRHLLQKFHDLYLPELNIKFKEI